MLKCDTGFSRIRGLLPSSVEVAHKTGTIGGSFDDVGIIYLPKDAGTSFSRCSARAARIVTRRRAPSANIARYAYDYFLFTAPDTASEGSTGWRRSK